VNRLAAAGALAAFLVAIVVIVIASATSGGGGSTVPPTTPAATTATQSTTTTTAPPPPKQVAVKLTGAGAYDPEADGHENDDLVRLAVDGDPATFWRTEHYKRFFKKGVGLVLDAGRSLGLSRVRTDLRGSSAQIQLGNNRAGPFQAVSANRPLTGTTRYTLKKGAAGRYIVIWITALPRDLGEAHVTEVRAARLATGRRAQGSVGRVPSDA
jgi:hypothetical protein